VNVENLPEGGVIQPLGPRVEAPTHLTHAPRLWTERMVPRPNPSVDPARPSVDPGPAWELPMLSAAQPGGDD
jgi:NADH-quinone oxidoreductase subunit G